VLYRFVALAFAGAMLAPAVVGPTGAAEPDAALTAAERERIERGARA
jgi:hypothetical protein